MMKGRLLNLAATISLVLCVAMIVLWVRGYFVWDAVYYRTKTPTAAAEVQSVGPNFGSVRSQFYAGFSRTISRRTGTPDELRTEFEWVRRPAKESRESWGWLGFHRETLIVNTPGFTASGEGYYAPCWLLAIATAMLPVVWGRTLFQARNKFREGCCPVCGYDLRATPDRCPECGTAPERR